MMSYTRAKSSPSKGRGKLPSVGALYEADLFKRIESTQLRSIFDGMEPQTCPAGTMFFMPEDSSKRLYILEQGRGGLIVTGIKKIRIIDGHGLDEIARGVLGVDSCLTPLNECLARVTQFAR